MISFQLCDLVDIENPTANSMQPGELLYDALDITNSSGQVEREHSFDASYMNAGIEYTYSGLIFKLRFIKTFTDDIHFQYTPFLLTGDAYQLDVFTVKDAYDFESPPPDFEGDVGEAFLYHTYPLYAKLTSIELVGDNYTQVGQPGEVIQFTIFNSTYSRALSNVTTNGNGTAIYEWYIDDATLLTTPASESFKIMAEWINGSGDLTQESIVAFNIKNPFGISVGPPSSLTLALDHEYSIDIMAYERWFDYNIYPILDQNGNPNETLLNLNYNDTVTPRLRNVSLNDGPGNMEVVMYYGGTSDPLGAILSCNNNTLTFTIRYRSDETIAGPTFPDTNEYLTFTLQNDSTHIWGTNTTQGLYSYQIIESVGEVITTTEIGGPADNKLVATLSTGESVYFNITLTDSEGLGSGRFDNGTINVDVTKTGEPDYNVGFKTWSDNSTFLGLNGSNFDITFTWDLTFITSVSPADYSGDVTFVITWTDAFGELKIIGEIDFILEFNAVP
ncbi:MAG: hypothetical protein ACFFCQ_13205 [Promethearchaeota archaeon]